ncbi:glycosyltransferase family 4 protein [Halomonas daqiaonensis]|uniref:Glycosyltransferase involved in cell wall bisynthesis n=1 Tax=Halomonas daqiaonensis TaxID=650850 RepID=A0A1H7GKJ3_9GAMM|nr:glycosyltransferase family 4 protein [Halomonas daqiaonensis]SEK38686.1 Glycosyltransferase involved in cell wall bisynthesis [Halomonas daqiaonensis]
MRILFLSDNFPPETNAPANRLYDHAVRWVQAGHEVTVVTCAPNFPEGEVFSGYRNRWHSVEQWEGIRVVRVKSYITSNEGFLRRTLDYVSFMVSGFIGGLFQKKPDLIVASSPQFFAAVGGWALAAVRRKPFVFELRDLWPASIVAVGAMEESRTIRVLEKLELFLYRRARRVVAVTQAFKQDLVERGIDGDKIDVVLNGVDLTRYQPMPADEQLRREHGLEGKFVVGYLGTHGMAHALDKVLEAAERLRHCEDIVFLFVGAGAAKAELEARVQGLGLTNVRFVPRQPKDAMPGYWSLCDLALIPLRDTPVFESVIPSKMFECMAMGIPVLMSLPEGEATGILHDAGAGVCVPPEDPAAMAEAIETLKDDTAQREALRDSGLAAAQTYSRDRQSEKMLAVLERAAGRDVGGEAGSTRNASERG